MGSEGCSLRWLLVMRLLALLYYRESLHFIQPFSLTFAALPAKLRCRRLTLFRTTTNLNPSLHLPFFWQLRPQMSSRVVWVCRHIQSHVSKSLCLVTLDEVVGRTPYRGRTRRPRKASTKRGNYLRTTFQLGPPPPQAHPSMGVQLTIAYN